MNTRSAALLGCLCLCGCAAQRELSWLSVMAPEALRAEVGQVVDVPLIVRNTGGAEVVIRGVDVDQALLQTCELLGFRPPAEAAPIELRSYRVHRTAYAVPAGGETVLTLQLRGTAVGEAGGEVDLCLDSFTCLTVRVNLQFAPATTRRDVVPLP